jgi:predicted ATPase/DNA-binding SARP family transcriptional activator
VARPRENAIVRNEIRVLGPLELIHERGPVPLDAPKERRLLAALVAEAGTSRSSDALTDAIWGASPPRSAPKLLQVYVSKLRKRLPAQTEIRTHGSGYALEVQDGVLDADRFERLLQEGRLAAQAGNHALAASVLGRALGLWRGAAYGELADEDFVRTEAQRLEELRLGALEDRLAAELELGRHVERLAELGALADSYPVRERLQAQLMLGLYRSGRQSEALDRYAETRRHLNDELGLEPGAELRDLQRRILQHDPGLAVAPSMRETAGLISEPLTPIIGRESELAELVELLGRDDVRLLVLTGAGGSGKTRLALEAARQSAGSFANGAAFVELAPVHDPRLVVSAILSALGIELVGSEPVATLVATLRGRELLLFLDNFEHLRDAGPVLVDLLSQTPRLTILVTSRVVLHLSGEHVYPVEPLGEDAALDLFLERALEADVRFKGDEAEAATAIRSICARLDGLPLAIELAAGRIRTLTPVELLAGLEQRLPLLTGGPRDLPARQQTLRSTLEWSVDLLDELERRDLARLSVFAGSCTVEYAETVCETTLERLSSLVDHNLLIRVVTLHGSRYSMLETIREHMSEQLDASGEGDAIRMCHAQLMLAIVRAAHLSEDDDEPYDQSVALLERDDIRAALDWAVDANVVLGLELASELENFWGPHAPAEGVRRIADLLARDADIAPLLRARALRNLAGAAHQVHAFDVADPAYEESLSISTELGDARGAALVRMRLAYRARERGDADLARSLLDELERDADGRYAIIGAQGALLRAYLAFDDGRLEDADALLDKSHELASGLRWAWWDTTVGTARLAVALERGDLANAERHGRSTLALEVEEEYGLAALQTITGLARVALARDDLERAGLLWGAVSEQIGGMLGPRALRWRDELRNEARPTFVAAVARGRGFELWDAAALALAEPARA